MLPVMLLCTVRFSLTLGSGTVSGHLDKCQLNFCYHKNENKLIKLAVLLHRFSVRDVTVRFEG